MRSCVLVHAMWTLVLFACSLCAGCIDGAFFYSLHGVAVDASTGLPLQNAIIELGESRDFYLSGIGTPIGADGSFTLEAMTGLACGGTFIAHNCSNPPPLGSVTLIARTARGTDTRTLELTRDQQSLVDGRGVVDLGTVTFAITSQPAARDERPN